jgi:hypothetical protein
MTGATVQGMVTRARRVFRVLEANRTVPTLNVMALLLEMADAIEGRQCEPQPSATEDGYCEWVCPTPKGYLMQCCDCGLIHEAEFRVAKYEPRPSEEFTVCGDPDMQAQLRMRRRDDLGPVRPHPEGQQPDESSLNGSP